MEGSCGRKYNNTWKGSTFFSQSRVQRFSHLKMTHAPKEVFASAFKNLLLISRTICYLRRIVWSNIYRNTAHNETQYFQQFLRRAFRPDIGPSSGDVDFTMRNRRLYGYSFTIEMNTFFLCNCPPGL